MTLYISPRASVENLSEEYLHCKRKTQPTIRNMDETAVPCYSPAEQKRRWELARSFLAQEGLDAMIVFGEHEDAGAAPYSFDTWFTNDRPGSTIVFPRQGEPIELVPFLNHFADHMEGIAAGDAIWISAHNVRLGRNSDALAKVLIELELTQSTIGVLGLEPSLPWHPQGLMPFPLWESIRSQFPAATFRSVAETFIPLILPLSEEEIAVIRHSANIGEEMAKAMVKTTHSGVPESEIYAAGMTAAYTRGAIIPSMHLNTGPEAILWGPPRWAWRPQKPRTIQTGDMITSEIFCTFGMRQTQHQLTIAVGKVHEDVERAAALARESYEAGLQMLQPNAKFGDVAEAMLKPIETAGGWVKGPQIHSLNPLAAFCRYPVPSHLFPASGPYPHIDGFPTALGDLQLKPGMTFAFEPSCGFGRHVVTLGGTVVVGNHGAIELNPFTARLHCVS